MIPDEVLDRFLEDAPVAVMVRAALEHAFAASRLDPLFDRVAEAQYTRDLTFSAVAGLLTQVVLGVKPSVHAAYRAARDLPVSVAAVYDKLNGVEPAVAAAVVRETADALAGVLAAWPGAATPDPIPGMRVRVVDGNHLAGTDRRLRPLRGSGAAALPGLALVVRDGRTGLLTHLAPFEDAYTGERGLADVVAGWAEAGDLWVADRAYATGPYLRGIAGRGAFFLIRHHAGLALTPAGDRVAAGRTATGAVFDQPVRVGDGADAVACRCVTVVLDRPTRGGDREVRVLTNAPADRAAAAALADVYRTRWRIESAFQELTTALRCEVNTLGYPRAALLGFALAVAAYDVLVLVRAAMASVRGREVVDREVSSYYLADEVGSAFDGLRIAVPAAVWSGFRGMSAAAFADWLAGAVAGVRWERYRKSPRGPKKPPSVARTCRGAHRSTARVLIHERGRTTP